MANEIQLNISLICAGQNLRYAPSTLNITESTQTKSWTTQTIPTTAGGTAIVVGAGVATLGVAILWNRDATNYLDVGLVVSAAFYPFTRIKPGEYYVMRLSPGVTFYGLAHTGATNLDILVLND